MINYTKIPDSLLQNTKLNLSSRVIYARLIYRINLSVNNDKAFYDNKQHFYYIVYKIKDLMHDCGLGRTTVINSLKQLVNYGLVVKHRLIHLVRLELPKFHLQTSTSQKSKLVKITKTKIKKHDSKSDNRLKESRNRWRYTNIPKIDSKLDHQNATKAIKFRRIPKPVIQHIQTLLNGKTFTKCINVILQAKRSVFKSHIRSNDNNKTLKDSLDFDSNNYFTFNNSKDFTKYIDHGLRKAWHNSKPGKLWHYFMKVCKTYYEYAVRWFYQNQNINGINAKTTNEPEIPIFRI